MSPLIISIIFLICLFLFKDINENMINYSQTPWCKKWSATNNQFVCGVNKHLQRKCSWICNKNKC